MSIISLVDTLPVRAEEADPVGIKEVAERLGVRRSQVDVWIQRGQFLERRWTIGGRPAWHWPDVEAWARATGRR